MKLPLPLVEVRWNDAATDHGWEDPSELTDEDELVVTLGFLVKETEKHIWIANSVDYAKMTNARIKIPRGMVVSITPLRVTKLKVANAKEGPADSADTEVQRRGDVIGPP